MLLAPWLSPAAKGSHAHGLWTDVREDEGPGAWIPGQGMDTRPSDHWPKLWESSFGSGDGLQSLGSLPHDLVCPGPRLNAAAAPIFKKPRLWKSLPE